MTVQDTIRVVSEEDLVWSDSPLKFDETDPPGREATVFESDNGFSFGIWERDVQSRRFEKDDHHEVAFILDGEVEIVADDGGVYRAGPGQFLVTPKGTGGYWRNLTPVRKIWAILDVDNT